LVMAGSPQTVQQVQTLQAAQQTSQVVAAQASPQLAQSSHSARYDEDQQAVIALAKEAKAKGGLTNAEAAILLAWAKEFNVPNHGPESHPTRPGKTNQDLHIHIGKTGHIPVI